MIKRKLIQTLLVLTFLVCSASAKAQNQQDAGWDILISAVSQAESRNNPKSVNGKHVGALQISPITVDECNRILKKKKYTHQDRYSFEKSAEMFVIIQDFYNPKHDVSLAIRLWNAGPIALKQRGISEEYYQKVMKVYREKLKAKK